MWTPLSPALREELVRFRLAYTCEQCEHFRDAEEACDLLYPIAPHRQATADRAGDGEPLLFCKMFEAR